MQGRHSMTKEEAMENIITAEELEKHNTEQDAWVSYHGFVYNVTEYI